VTVFLFAIEKQSTSEQVPVWCPDQSHLSIDQHRPNVSRKLLRERDGSLRPVARALKTANGLRQVDLHPAIAALLKEFVGDRTTGFLFCTENGKASVWVEHHPAAICTQH
jgi:hypothetical protein